MSRCKEEVWRGFRKSPCYRDATRDGYCGAHHPEAVEKRRAKYVARSKAKLAREEAADRARAVRDGLKWATNDQLMAEVKRRGMDMDLRGL